MKENRITIIPWYPYLPTAFFATEHYLSFGLHGHVNSDSVDSVNMLWQHRVITILLKSF